MYSTAQPIRATEEEQEIALKTEIELESYSERRQRQLYCTARDAHEQDEHWVDVVRP